MNKKILLKKIKEKAKLDQINRRDPRFIATIGFLVGKGLLRTNYEVPLRTRRRLRIEDAIWAGQNVEPRILEVLPAAVLHFEKHFDLDRNQHNVLYNVVKQLRTHQTDGDDFLGIPFKKLRIWADFPLLDKRTKRLSDKKVLRTFRLHPDSIKTLETIAKKRRCTHTEALETLLREAEQ